MTKGAPFWRCPIQVLPKARARIAARVQPVLGAAAELVTPLRQARLAEGRQPVIQILLPPMMPVHDAETGKALTGDPLENCLHRSVRILHAAQSRVRHGQGLEADIA